MENSGREYLGKLSEDIQQRIARVKERIDRRYPGFRSTPLQHSRSMPAFSVLAGVRVWNSQTEVGASQAQVQQPAPPTAKVQTHIRLLSGDAEAQHAHLLADIQAMKRRLFRAHKSVKSISTGILSPSSQHAKQFIFPEVQPLRKTTVPALKIKTQTQTQDSSCLDLPTVISRDESSLSDSEGTARKKPNMHSLKSQLEMLSGGSSSKKDLSSPASSALSIEVASPPRVKLSARSLESLEEEPGIEQEVSFHEIQVPGVTTGQYVQQFVTEQRQKMKMTRRSRKQVVEFSYKQDFSDKTYATILQRIQDRMRKMEEEAGRDTHRKHQTEKNMLHSFDIQTKIRDGLIDKISKLQSCRELD